MQNTQMFHKITCVQNLDIEQMREQKHMVSQ